jgi:ankyrin repeat protein
VSVRHKSATPVFVAAQIGQPEVVKALAEVGADMNVPMNDGTTPVLMAAKQGHLVKASLRSVRT